MNKINILKSALFAILVFIIVVWFIVNINKIGMIVEIEEIQMSMIYDGSAIVGFDVNSTALTFGKIPLGSASKRKFTVTNDLDFPVKIKIKKEGDIAEYITLSDNSFMLDIGEEKEIQIMAIPRENMEQNEYKGALKVLSIK